MTSSTPASPPALSPAAGAAGHTGSHEASGSDVPSLDVVMVSPAPLTSRKGNGVTARRWRDILRELGHCVTAVQDYRENGSGPAPEVLIALHARRSYNSIARFHAAHPDRPLIVALTGTDLYGDIRSDPLAQQSLEWATHLITLQPAGVDELPERLREKVRVIYQSCVPPAGALRPAASTSRDEPDSGGSTGRRRGAFQVCVMGHLRAVKDPFRTAEAARLLPPSSRIRVIHLGGIIDAEMQARAHREMADNPRYHWLGDLPRWQALRHLARSQLLCLTSIMEGGANVVTESLACGVPVVSSHIAGSIGLLGEDYPGYFPVGDTAALATLLYRTETDHAFYEGLRARCAALAHLADPAEERRRWAALMAEVAQLLAGQPTIAPEEPNA